VVGDKKHVRYFYTERGMLHGMLMGRRIREDRKLNISMHDKYARAWKAIDDRLQRPHYLSRVDHERKIRSRKQRPESL